MADDEGNKKDEVLKLLSEVEAKAQRIEGLGQNMVRSARLSRDVAAPVRDALSVVPAEGLPLEQWDRQLKGLRSWGAAADELHAATRTMANSFGAVSLSVASTSSETFDVVRTGGLVFYRISSENRSRFDKAVSRFRSIIDQIPLVENVRSSMDRLGLNPRLVKEAQGAIERPVEGEGGALSVLIALRECILQSIADLLKRRPTQEPTPKMPDKISSLGRQCGRPNLPETHFETLGSQAKALIDDLSGTKQKAMTRQELNAFFNRGLLFFDALLNSVDESRLRPL